MRAADDERMINLEWPHVYELLNLNYCNQKLRKKVCKHDPTRFPSIYFRKKKAQHNLCSFRCKVFIHKVSHQQASINVTHK